jgi:DNA-binding PadR family transcriptional regulator
MRFGHRMRQSGGEDGFGSPQGRGLGRGGLGGSRGGFGGGPRSSESRGRGMGGGRRRVLDAAELRLLLLRLIAEQPRHGYDLIRDIEARTNGAYAPSPGVIYPTLTLLQDMALIEEEAVEGSRKSYRITPAGVAEVDANAALTDAVLARFAELGAVQDRTDGGPVRRAMHNLRTVLLQRLSRSDADAETLFKVTALIDETAQKIERL